MTNKDNIITEEHRRFAQYAKAFAHPIRVYILSVLREQSCCYSLDLSDVLPIAKSTLSQHLKELKNCGLIQGEIEAPKIRYCINEDNWKEAQHLFSNYFKLEKEEELKIEIHD